MSNRKRCRICWPCWVCSTSGWNCTPASRRPTFSNEATGAPAERPVTTKPFGLGSPRRRGSSTLAVLAATPRSSTPVEHLERRPPEFAATGCRHLAAECLHHRLEAVADAEHGYARRQTMPGRLAAPPRRTRWPGRRTARSPSAPSQHVGHRRGMRHDLGVDVGLANPARDQLRVLGTIVHNQDDVRLHRASLQRATDGGRTTGNGIQSAPRSPATAAERASRPGPVRTPRRRRSALESRAVAAVR